MGCIVSIVRSAIALFMGIVVFVGFLFLVFVGNFSEKLLDVDFYKNTIVDQDSYNRIYDEVLVDQELRNKTDEILGNIQVLDQDEIAGLLRQILPPAYLESQVEGSIQRTVDYLNESEKELDVFIDLGPPLDNLKPVLFAYLDVRIGELVLEASGVPDCSPQAISDFSGRYVERFNQLADGAIPESVPALELLSQSCRSSVFEVSFGLLMSDHLLSSEAKRGLVESQAALKTAFVAGETLEVIRVATRSLMTPLMDNTINKIQLALAQGDRLDLIDQLVEWDDSLTETKVRSDLYEVRTWLARSRYFGTITTLTMVIVGAVLIGLIHLPSLSGILRWPGITLLSTGVFSYVMGRVLESQVADRLTTVVEQRLEQVPAIPPSMADLVADLLVSFGSQLSSGYAGPSIAIIVIGTVLVGGSFLVSWVKSFIPIVR